LRLLLIRFLNAFCAELLHEERVNYNPGGKDSYVGRASLPVRTA